MTRPALIGCILILARLVAGAQQLTLGSEFQVNTFTTDTQRYPSLASAGDGSFVLVWEGYGQDGSKAGVFGQRYGSSGARAGSEFQINTFTTLTQYEQGVAVDRDGNFLVVWKSLGTSGGDSVFGRRFDASGASAGPEFRIPGYTAYGQAAPAVATDSAGHFVVVWQSNGQDGSGYGIFGRRLTDSGSPIGAEFPVNTYTTGTQRNPSVAMSESGDFLVVWASDGQDGSGSGIFGQHFDANGAKVGPEFQVNTYTTANQSGPHIAANARGDFVVVWTSHQHVSSGYGSLGYDVIGRRLDSSGIRLGDEFPLSPWTGEDRESPSVAVERDGSFLTAWEGKASGALGVFAQRFDRTAQRVGDPFALNTYTTGFQTSPAVATDGRGFVASWSSYGQDGSRFAVIARRQDFHSEALAVDASAGSGTSSDVNGVLEPGETVVVQPTWTNNGDAFADLTGSTPLLFCFIGTPCVVAVNRSADYGTMPPNTIARCDDSTPTGCYTVSAGGPRPGTHWDGGFGEDLSVGGQQFWSLHVGDSFTDVPRSQPFYKKIETLLHYGVTSGCAATQYCPGTPVNRAQMAIFIAKAMTGSGSSVPVTGTLSGILFGSSYNCTAGGNSLLLDVAPTDSSCRHAHYLAARNVTLGCGNNDFCPNATVTRDAMASFIAKAIVAPGGGNAVPLSYGPDPNTGLSYSCNPASPSVHFTDVPASNTFCKHIHYLWAKGVVNGCTTTQYCPSGPVARDAMAKFIANGFGLQLYGP
jgi:hypothetical protein